MNIEPYIAVTGVGPLMKIVTSKSNGLVLEDLDSGRSKFYSVRKHQFTPLGTVAIYTLGGTQALIDVFISMDEKYKTHPPVSIKAEKHVIEEYFERILPEYDEDRVPIRDMKKVIKWFSFLKERGLLEGSDEEE